MTRRLASDEAAFLPIQDNARAVFDITGTFPEIHCLIPSAGCFLFEYVEVAGGPGWPLLRDLAVLHGDGNVEVLVVEPGPVEFHRSFGLWPAFVLGVEAGEDEYWEALTEGPPGSEADALLYRADAWVAVGASRSWGFWNEHGFDVSVAYSTEVKGLPEWADAMPTIGVGLFEQLVAQNFRDGQLPGDFRRSLRTIFGGDPSAGLN